MGLHSPDSMIFSQKMGGRRHSRIVKNPLNIMLFRIAPNATWKNFKKKAKNLKKSIDFKAALKLTILPWQADQ